MAKKYSAFRREDHSLSRFLMYSVASLSFVRFSIIMLLILNCWCWTFLISIGHPNGVPLAGWRLEAMYVNCHYTGKFILFMSGIVS